MKKIIVSLLILFSLQAQAVLKESNLNRTLTVLRSELEMYQREENENMKRFENGSSRMRSIMLERVKESNQIALMLYSQKIDYIFDLTYACHEATSLYQRFTSREMPFDEWVGSMDVEVERYSTLITSLQKIPNFVLDSIGRRDRDSCMSLASSILSKIRDYRNKLTEEKARYDGVVEKLKTMNDYAEMRYDNIRQNIFINAGDSYFSLLSRLPMNWKTAKKTAIDKYKPDNAVHSEWKGNIILYLFTFIMFYVIVATGLCFVVIRYLLPRRLETPDFLKKRPYIILAATSLTFAILLMVLHYFVLSHNFFLMASGLLIEYAWLFGAVMVSLLVRLSSQQIHNGFRVYSPILVLGFIIIAFRIVFIPNELANLLFPPIILLSTFWQWRVIVKCNKLIPSSDVIYTWISLAVMLVAVIMSWSGYTLMSVQTVIWWLMMLTAIQSITCIYDLLSQYEKAHYLNADISKTWFYDFVCKAVVPVVAVYCMMLSIYWAASVFDLTEWCKIMFNSYFIDIDNVAHISFANLSFVVALFFVVRYLIYVGKAFYTKRYKQKHGESKGMMSLGINIVSILVWGLYVVVAMIILQINNAGLVVAIGGMSTGIGFAMKDTIENLFYGISLMTGRVNIGDIIECDGVRGKVTNINYQSTLIEPVDGSVMAFLNSQLFSKNFKNLTRNHGFELVKIPVGVAYGTNVENARSLILDNVSKLDCYDKKKSLTVMFDNFGDNSVDLTLVIWVPVKTKVASISQIKEVIYDVFNANNIEIPFPQRDIYIRKIVDKNV